MFSVKVLAIVIGATIAGLGAIANAFWGPRARMKRRLERGATRLADGEIVTLVGKVRTLDNQLTAPLSGRACVGYEAMARLYDGDPRARAVRLGHHRTVEHELVDKRLVPFELVTRDGPVIVDATTADLALPIIPLIPRVLEREAGFLAAHGHPPEQASIAGFDEIVVLAEDVVAVQGMAVVEHAHDAAERGYRDAPTRVRIVAHPDHPLTIGKPK